MIEKAPDTLRVAVTLAKALEKWRADAYPCEATTCKCESRWHMKSEPTAPLAEASDAALAEFEKLMGKED